MPGVWINTKNSYISQTFFGDSPFAATADRQKTGGNNALYGDKKEK